MTKKVFTDESLVAFVNEIKNYTDDSVSANTHQELTDAQIDAVCGTYTEGDGGSVVVPSVSVDETLTQSGMAADAKVVGDRLATKADAIHIHSYNDLTDRPVIPEAYIHPESHPASMITGLSSVAISGSYNDLDDQPTIPTSLSALSEDETHRTVTDAQISGWDAKAEKGDDGITPTIGDNGNWYVGDTDTGVKAKGDTGAKGDSGFVPPYAQTVADCVDTTKMYLLPDGYLYAYVESTQMQEITEKIVGTSDNPFLEGNRISAGNIYNDIASITTTPYIDLLTSPSGHAFSAGDVVSVEFKGADYFPSSDLGSYYRTQFLKADKSYIKSGNTYQFKDYYPYHNAEWDADGTSRFTYTVGSGNGYDANIRYIRMCANNATEANSDISVTYTAEVTGYQWTNTGLKYSPTLTNAEKIEIAEMAAAMIDT